jgi:hypothetical protein
MNAIHVLERAAGDAHHHGLRWSEFWDQHGAAVCRAELHDRHRFARLVRRGPNITEHNPPYPCLEGAAEN